MGESLFAALGQEVDPTIDMAINIADRCLSLNSAAPAGASTNLVDIVTMENVSNPSQSVSIRDAIFDMARSSGPPRMPRSAWSFRDSSWACDEAVSPIESQFNGVLSSMTGVPHGLRECHSSQEALLLR